MTQNISMEEYSRITPQIEDLTERWSKNCHIDRALYQKYDVKRGLRDALKLRKGGQNADHGAAVGRSGVDVLVDGHEIHAVRRENVLDEIECVLLTAAQAVELVDNDALDLAVSDAVDELRHGRAVKARTGKAAVHIPRKAADALHAAVGFELFGLRRERISLVGLRLGRNAQI